MISWAEFRPEAHKLLRKKHILEDLREHFYRFIAARSVNRHIIGSGLLATFLSFLRWFLESTSVLMKPGVFCGTTVDAELVRSSEVLSLVYTIEKTNLQQTIHTTSADRRLDIDTSSKKTILLGHAYHCLSLPVTACHLDLYKVRHIVCLDKGTRPQEECVIHC